MRRFAITYVVVLVCLLSFQAHLSAKEEPLKLFGMGASVEETTPGLFTVKTSGKKEGEGFVYNPHRSLSTNQVKSQIELKGTGNVNLTIEETDARGKFLKEKEMKVALTKEWKTYELDFELESTSSQLDLLVLTPKTSRLEFKAKNIQMKDME